MSEMVTAVISLGANLGDPQQQITAALTALNQIDGVRIKAISPFYQTKPVGVTTQPDFINAVILVNTTLDPHRLLQNLQQLELNFGRERTIRFGPRTLDLDIIDYNGQKRNDLELILPHPRAHDRAFVMVPLARIAPYYPIGDQGTAATLAKKLLQEKPREKVKVLV
ncbi:MAG: 2-amino-4-hydroxy-6-hydroxymethyldihydropteridine diphosphokinase [Snodgrassella sp.]|nr:2-amino-4-hydroxy-6-hydroxymethyldihydropteridine diphosphokinase [Snodgrassella sp.]